MKTLSQLHHRPIALAAIAAAALATTAPAIAAADYTLTFQDVTFEVDLVDFNTLTLTLLGSDAASGDWTGIASLDSFQLKDVGSFDTGTATGPGGFVNVDKELNANGCAGGSGGPLRLCFTGFTAVASSLSWTIDVTGGVLNPGDDGPHLKVRFVDASGDKVGSLLSANLPLVPEPASFALMLAGLAAVGVAARRARNG